MTRKEQILRFVSRQDDNVTFDKIMYHLSVMRGIEIGMEQLKRGEGIDHEDLMNELLNDDAQEKAHLDAPRTGRAASGKKAHSQGSSKNGSGVRRAAKKPRS